MSDLEIKIQAGLSDEEVFEAKKFIENFLSRLRPNAEDRLVSWKHMTCGGHGGRPLGRGLLGERIGKTELVFRRISKNKRIFGVVRASELCLLDGSPVEIDLCVCRLCGGGQRVKWKSKIPEMVSIEVR